MDGYDVISKLSEALTGEEFVNTMLIEEDNKYTFSINNHFNITCPEPMQLLDCNKECKECWKNTLKKYGYKFEDHQEEEDSCHVINLFTPFSFQEMLDKLKNNSELVFYGSKFIYFIKNDKLKRSKYNTKSVLNLTPYAIDVEINLELLQGEYYETDIVLSKIISEICHSEVKKYLTLGHNLIYVTGDRCWNIWKEENRLRYYSEDVDYTTEKGTVLFGHDMLSSLYTGQWFIEDEIEY